MILKKSSKLIEIDENLMKTKLFVTKIILVTFGDINVNKNHSCLIVADDRDLGGAVSSSKSVANSACFCL